MAGDLAAALRRGIDDARQALVPARSAGHPHEAQLHAARLAEAIQAARLLGVKVDSWVGQPVQDGPEGE